MSNSVGHGVRSAIKRWSASLVAQSRAQPVFFWACTVLVTLGLLLRARGYLFDRRGFWMDEAAWAMMLMRDPLVDLLIRPPGFMSVAKLGAVLFGPSEVVLRAQAWLAGIATLLLAVPLSRRLFTSPTARLLFIAIIAFHPGAIDLSKEFKPYSVSLFAHLGLLFLTLRYLESQRRRDLAIVLSVALIGNLWTQDLVMVYPGLFLVLGWDTLWRRRANLPWVLATAIGIVLLLVLQYVLIWSKLKASEADYWGNKYGVFYTGEKAESYFTWWLRRYTDLAAFPGVRNRDWDAQWLSETARTVLAQADDAIWLILYCIGAISLLVRRRFRLALLLLLPMVVHTLINALGYWPAGVFRTNLFFLCYTASVAGMALEAPAGGVKRWLAIAPTAVLVVLPLVLFDRSWNARKQAMSHDTDVGEVMVALAEVPEAPEPVRLIVARRMCPPYQYYSTIHPGMQDVSRTLKRRYEMTCTKKRPPMAGQITEMMSGVNHAWLMIDTTPEGLSKLHLELPDLIFNVRLETYPLMVELTRAR